MFSPTRINTVERSGYQDVIMPNTDYYYMARMVDGHANISNPTNIFYVRMVHEEGFPPYIIIKAHNIADFHRNIVSRRFKKFVKIQLKDFIRNIEGSDGPTAQISYKSPNSQQLNKYKFRVTSLKTGKQIDINIGLSMRTELAPQSWFNPYLISPSQATEEELTNTGEAAKINLSEEDLELDKGMDFDL